jgi:hypothetical protein
VERTRPRQINLLDAKDFRSDSLDSPDHFVSAGKRQQQGTVRINPADDKIRNPMGKGLRLPGASASYHQKRRRFRPDSESMPCFTARRCSLFKSVK